MMHKRAPTTTSSGIGPSAQSEEYLSEAGPDALHSDSPSSPPTYDAAHKAAIKSSTSGCRRPGTRWLTIEWSDDSDPFFPPFLPTGTPPGTPKGSQLIESLQGPDAGYSQSLPPLPLSPQQSEFYRLPKAPELCQAMSDFEQCHSDIRVHAKAIFNVTKKLVDAKERMVNVQEYWMEVGMNDLAHILIPLLDFAEETMPRYTFPPLFNPTVAPGI